MSKTMTRNRKLAIIRNSMMHPLGKDKPCRSCYGEGFHRTGAVFATRGCKRCGGDGVEVGTDYGATARKILDALEG